jgi:enoyl-CoA hydratase
MSETTQVGQIRTEVHGHVFKIVIDNVAKKNSFSPQMMAQMSDAMTLLDRTDDYWVGVLCADGPDFTAGLDMPKFFGPKAENTEIKPGNIDAFALKSRCRKPIVTAVQGICFTIGIEMILAGDSLWPPTTPGSAKWNPSAGSRRSVAPISGTWRGQDGGMRCIICSCATSSARRGRIKSGLFRKSSLLVSRFPARWKLLV